MHERRYLWRAIAWTIDRITWHGLALGQLRHVDLLLYTSCCSPAKKVFQGCSIDQFHDFQQETVQASIQVTHQGFCYQLLEPCQTSQRILTLWRFIHPHHPALCIDIYKSSTFHGLPRSWKGSAVELLGCCNEKTFMRITRKPTPKCQAHGTLASRVF